MYHSIAGGFLRALLRTKTDELLETPFFLGFLQLRRVSNPVTPMFLF